MRIVHISPAYSPVLGGAELHLRKISEGLASRGHEVTVLTTNVRRAFSSICGGLPEVEVIDGVKVVRFQPDGGVLGSALKTWRRIPGGWRSSNMVFGKDEADWMCELPILFQLVPHLLGLRTDIVTSAHWCWPTTYYTYLARKLKRFILVGIPLFHTAEAWSHRSFYKKMLAQCDAVIVNTSYEADFVQERARTRVEVAGVGIDPKSFEHRKGTEVRARYALGTFPVVGFVGRQVAGKGAATVVRAMETVWKWNQEVRLILAGYRPYPDEEVESLIKGLRKFERGRIVRIDNFPEEDKPSILDAFDVFVLPSIAESFGIAYLEAWMCKKPVIGARIGPTQCVIDEGIDGLLANPGDPQDTGRAIIELLSDSRKRERMAMSGHDKTVVNYTWDKVTDKVEKLYLELLAAKRAGGLSHG